MKIEYFHAAACKRCSDAREELRAAALKLDPSIIWREVDAVGELDYAVELGVLALPALAIDGQLLLGSLTAEQVRKALLIRRKELSSGRG
jgi:thioredoxin 1